MKCFVTGGAGFIGSNLIDELLARGNEVVCYDNLSTGQERFLERAMAHAGFTFVHGDLLDASALQDGMQSVEIVFHLAANADVRYGTEHPRKDLEQNTIATYNVLSAMLANDVRKIVFSSTGSIYGETKTIPTPEDAPFPVQTSLYGASKLACEGMITAFSEGFGFQVWIFRFVSILGERYSHGHVFDFYRQLIDHPAELTVLGDGKQRKSYLYVKDCVRAILFAVENSTERVNIFNLGTDQYIQVNDSVKVISDAIGLSPEIRYTGGERGWTGDNPFIYLDCSRIRRLGWKPELNIREGVAATVQYLVENQWLLEARG